MMSAVAAPDQLPDHRHSGQLGHQQPARRLRVREQQQVVLAQRPASVCGRTHCKFRRLPGMRPARAAARVLSMSGTAA